MPITTNVDIGRHPERSTTDADDRRVRARKAGGLAPIPGVDAADDPRYVHRRLYRFGRLRGWWSRVLDPVQLDPGGGWWHRYGPAVWVAALYAGVSGAYVVMSSLAVSDGGTAAAEVGKGLAFVAVTALLLAVLLIEYGRRASAAAERLRSLIESTGDLTYRFRRWPNVGFEYMSPGITHWIGLTPDDHYANPDIGLHLVHPDDRGRLSELLVDGRSDGTVPIRWVAPDGRVLHTAHDFFPVHDRRGRMVAVDGRIRDITDTRRDRIEAELGLAMLGWLADGLDARTVIERTCDGIVRMMEVEVAWYGVPLPDGSVRLECAAGATSFVDSIEIRWDDGPLGAGPTGSALREGVPVMMRPDESGDVTWRQRARGAAVTAVLAVPLRVDGRTVGALTVLSRFGNPFDGRNIERFERTVGRLALIADQLTPSDHDLHDRSVGRPATGPIDVAAALADGRVEPWWQPQVDPTGRIVALEALLRVRDVDGSIMTPDRVIPAAVDAGLMVSLGRQLRSRAITTAAPWLTDGLDRICLNVAVEELVSPGFIVELDDLVAANRLTADRIELELVETGPLSSDGLRVLERLVSFGYRISVDDYGSGWASLGHLARIPALVLKIDRMFVTDLTTSDRARALVQSTFDLGRVLDLETVAEGVETIEQAELLCEMGCDLLQGFLFSRPRPSDETALLLAGVGTDDWPTLHTDASHATTAHS